MRAATEVLDEIVRAVKPRKGCAISLREMPAENPAEPNWQEGADPLLRPAELSRLLTTTKKIRQSDPKIDWTGVQQSLGRCRQIVKPDERPS